MFSTSGSVVFIIGSYCSMSSTSERVVFIISGNVYMLYVQH